MSEQDCGNHGEEVQTRKRIGWGVLGLFVAAVVVVCLVWAILHPHGLRFILQDATVYSFNLTQPDVLYSSLQVTVSSRNPNDRIGVYYEKLLIYASCHNQKVTLSTLLPETYQGHQDINVWSPFLYGTTVAVSPFLGVALSQDLQTGMILLNIKIDGQVRWKVGTWISGSYSLHVNCPALIMLADRSFAGQGIKYQLVQKCNVDVHP